LLKFLVGFYKVKNIVSKFYVMYRTQKLALEFMYIYSLIQVLEVAKTLLDFEKGSLHSTAINHK